MNNCIPDNLKPVNHMIYISEFDVNLEGSPFTYPGWYLVVMGQYMHENAFGPFHTSHFWEQNWYAQYLISDSPIKNKLNIKGVMQ